MAKIIVNRLDEMANGWLCAGLPDAELLFEAAREIERLTAALKYQDARDGRIGTHGPGCYSWGLGHYECALGVLSRAPVAIMDNRTALGLCAPAEADFPALYALQGHRVALVDLGPNEKANRPDVAAQE